MALAHQGFLMVWSLFFFCFYDTLFFAGLILLCSPCRVMPSREAAVAVFPWLSFSARAIRYSSTS